MKSSVIIKGNKYGFAIVLNPALPFEILLKEVEDKFRESKNFFHTDRSVAVSFEGRDLTDGEQTALVDAIARGSGLVISYIIDGASALETKYKMAIENREREGPKEDQFSYSDPKEEGEEEDHLSGEDENSDEESENLTGPDMIDGFPAPKVHKNGQFYRGTLRSGQKIEVPGSIVILGDVNPGAVVVAGGNVVVIGCLKGTVYAGCPDGDDAMVIALTMDPMQIQIGHHIARSPDHKQTKERRFLKKHHRPEFEAKMAFVDKDGIFIETITRSLISELSLSEIKENK